MALREVEITLISAKDIKNHKIFGKQSPCAMVAVYGHNQRQGSRVAKEMGTEPVWNQKFTFFVDEQVLRGRSPMAVVQIHHSSNLSDSPLGMARIPLLPALNKPGELQFGAYPLQRPSGRTQGFVNVSFKVGQPGKGAPASASGSAGATAAGASAGGAATAAAASRASPVTGQPYGGPPVGVPQGYPQGYPYPTQGDPYRQSGYPGYPGAPPPAYYRQQQNPNVVVVNRGGGYGGYGGGYGGYGGGMGMGMGGFGGGMLLGGLGGLALGEAIG